MDACSKNDSKSLTCFDHSNSSVLDVLHATVPNCHSGHWETLTPEWKALFYIHVALFGLLFLLLAIWCLVSLWKQRTLMRLRRTKIFIAVDVALMILGFSRALFYVLDPYGISGYCSALACVVVSRVLASLTLPSLTASYTLVFFILWHVSTVKLRRSKFQRWKVIVPICFVLYFIAVATELVCAFAAYPAIFLLLACEFAFMVGGLVVCTTFLFVGLKILKSVRRTAQETSSACRDASLAQIPSQQLEKSLSVSITDKHVVHSNGNGQMNSTSGAVKAGHGVSFATQSPHQPVCSGSEKFVTCSGSTSSLCSKSILASKRSKVKLPAQKHHSQAIRKVSIITYAVAVLGGLYALLGLAQFILLVIRLFGPCPEEEDVSPDGSNPYVWIAFRYASSAMELLLACLLVYSVNEVRPLFNMLRKIVCSVLHCRNGFQTGDTLSGKEGGHHKDYNSVNQCSRPSAFQKQDTVQMASEASVEGCLPANACTNSAENLISANLYRPGQEDRDHERNRP